MQFGNRHGADLLVTKNAPEEVVSERAEIQSSEA
jgi:hypothetical protein